MFNRHTIVFILLVAFFSVGCHVNWGDTPIVEMPDIAEGNGAQTEGPYISNLPELKYVFAVVAYKHTKLDWVSIAKFPVDVRIVVLDDRRGGLEGNVWLQPNQQISALIANYQEIAFQVDSEIEDSESGPVRIRLQSESYERLVLPLMPIGYWQVKALRDNGDFNVSFEPVYRISNYWQSSSEKTDIAGATIVNTKAEPIAIVNGELRHRQIPVFGLGDLPASSPVTSF